MEPVSRRSLRGVEQPTGGRTGSGVGGDTREAAETLTGPVWHYAGFGITHPGLREDCEPCTLARDMAVDAWNDPYWWGTPGWTAMEGR